MMNDELNLQNCRVDAVNAFLKFHIKVDVWRLDLIHPVISGNKWFKLTEHLKDAQELNKSTLLTFGGAYSNHIVATAAAAKKKGLGCIGIIRGEKPVEFSNTLIEAIHYGMKIHFVSWEEYKMKTIPAEVSLENVYVINEGGYGRKGAEGIYNLLRDIDYAAYTHILAAVGTGTSLAGLVAGSRSKQNIVGISVMKNNLSLQEDIESLLDEKREFKLVHDYHFGGYAKYNAGLIQFMNEWYQITNIPSDFVYTGKLFFALSDLIQKNYFPPDSKLLVIHSGGLQGNRSLPKGTLIF